MGLNMLLTEQEIYELADDGVFLGNVKEITRAIEAKVIEKIKAQGPAAWLHSQRTDSDVVTDAVKHVWGKVVVGYLALYDIPLYKLPEGD